MRHQVKGRKLGRSTPHRKATLQALSVALIKEKRIKTTLAKAKELKRYVEPVITKAKVDSTHNRRQVFASLQDKYAVSELYNEIMPQVGERPGGYTRVVKIGTRLGDAAQLAVIELVDFNDVKPDQKETKKKRTRRAGRSNKPTDDESSSADEKVEKAEAKTEKKEAPKKGKAQTDKDDKASEEVKEKKAEKKTKEKKATKAKAKSAKKEDSSDTSEDTPEEKK